MKALVGDFNQEKALVGAFSVIVQQVVEPMDRFTALVQKLTLNRNLFYFAQHIDCKQQHYGEVTGGKCNSIFEPKH